MSDKPPTPPAELPTEIVDTLNEYAPDRLQHVARYAEELTEYKTYQARIRGGNEDEVNARPEDLPEDVPPKATITIKEINDNRYYYWQWRDGEKIRSKYKAPVDPAE